MVNGKLRMADRGTGDLRAKVTNESAAVYTVVLNKTNTNVKILNSSGATVAQYNGNQSVPMMLQGAKNYLMTSLNTRFSCDRVRNSNGVVLT